MAELHNHDKQLLADSDVEYPRTSIEEGQLFTSDATLPLHTVGSDNTVVDSNLTQMVEQTPTIVFDGIKAGVEDTLSRRSSVQSSPSGRGRWLGRAEVVHPAHARTRAHRPEDLYLPITSGEDTVSEEEIPSLWQPSRAESRRWLLPALATTAVLVIFAVVATGAGLIINATDSRPAISQPAASAPDGLSPTHPLGSVIPATPEEAYEEDHRSTPSHVVPVNVVVPRLSGKSEKEATAALSALGLDVSVSSTSSKNSEAGTVVFTYPPEGSSVPVGSQITLIIAEIPLLPFSPLPLPFPSQPVSPSTGSTPPEQRPRWAPSPSPRTQQSLSAAATRGRDDVV